MMCGVWDGSVPASSIAAHGVSLDVAQRLVDMVHDPVNVKPLAFGECDAALTAVASLCSDWARWWRRAEAVLMLRHVWKGLITLKPTTHSKKRRHGANTRRVAALAQLLALRRLGTMRGEWEVADPLSQAVLAYL